MPPPPLYPPVLLGTCSEHTLPPTVVLPPAVAAAAVAEVEMVLRVRRKSNGGPGSGSPAGGERTGPTRPSSLDCPPCYQLASPRTRRRLTCVSKFIHTLTKDASLYMNASCVTFLRNVTRYQMHFLTRRILMYKM